MVAAAGVTAFGLPEAEGLVALGEDMVVPFLSSVTVL